MLDTLLSQLADALAQAGSLTPSVFAALLFIVLEASIPMLATGVALLRRWSVNISLYLLNLLLLWGFTRLLGWGISDIGETYRFGLLHWFPNWPLWAGLLAVIVILDLFVYVSHRLLHSWRPLWRLHLVHHSDLEVDVSTTFRHHPFEFMFGALILMLGVALSGASLSLLLLYDLLRVSVDCFAHANIKLPSRLEGLLRLVFVTSDMHRVHHAAQRERTNSNYGGIFSFWDRLFGTHVRVDAREQLHMPLGLEYFRARDDGSLLATLSQPLRYQPLSKA